MANTPKRTPEKDLVILDALREWPTFSHAARKARIARSTLSQWRREDQAFNVAVLAAQDEGFDAIEDKLVDQTKRGDTTAMIFLLKGRRRPIYGDKVDVSLKIREKAESLAEHLGVPVEDVIAEAEAVAAGSWDAWSPQS